MPLNYFGEFLAYLAWKAEMEDKATKSISRGSSRQAGRRARGPRHR